MAGCARPPDRIALAAAERGRVEAGILLPQLPAECRRAVPHAPAGLGDNVVIIWARERAQLDQANGVIRRCAENYDTVKSELEGR